MSNKIIQLNESAINGELKNLVKNSVEETLNALLDHETNELVNAERYGCFNVRRGYLSGHYDRIFTTAAGDVTLHVPQMKGIPFETAIIDRYRRRENSKKLLLKCILLEYLCDGWRISLKPYGAPEYHPAQSAT